ncbi:MAG: hypothetical protein EOP42_09120 [Sphingobacteriaceae bacterium]|nr:MAG: hypothetical protein EOP42_09120 [Sphingobacteriaceae bacterium]
MKISDKELDDLFNSKLNDIEIEPNTNLWNNIAAELDQKPKKKSIVPVLRIAAGIIVILSAGLLFLQKNEPVNNQLVKKTAKLELRKIDPSKNQIKNLGDKNSMLLLSAKNKAVKEASAKNKTKTFRTKTFIAAKPKVEENIIQTLAQVKPENVKINPSQTQVALVPDASISLKPQSETEILQPVIVKPPVLAAAIHPVKVKHKRIRSIGDVVNLVMEKVDKREDKLIQFSDSDDGDESNVTGINLGIINLKKEK